MINNQITRALSYFAYLPAPLRTRVMSRAFGNAVPLVGTCGAEYLDVSPHKVVVRIKNRRAVRNHIKGVHACAMVLAAETATGFIVGINLPDDKIPLIKSMQVNFKQRAQGDIIATATLNEAQIVRIQTDAKGDVTVPVILTDSEQKNPVEFEIVWAWVSKSPKTE